MREGTRLNRAPINRRRVLIAGSAAALAPFAFAQTPNRTARIHVLHGETRDQAEPLRKALLDGLQARGWSIGRNLEVEVHYADGEQENLVRLAERAAAAAPDVIVVSGPRAALELKKVGTSIPVVFIAVFDPIGLGLGQSLARPGGSFTGLSTSVPDTFFAKQLELFREAVPNVTRIGLLSNPNNPMHTLFRDRRVKGVNDLKMEAVEVQAASRQEIEPAFREAAAKRAKAMYVGGDPMMMSNRPLIAELAMRHGLPTMFLLKEHVEDGGLMSYGTDLTDLHRRGAEYVDRILRGAKPADLPIAQPVKFDLVINLKTARALGLKVPQSLLVRAERVIE